jgi:hypothetical protein
MTFSSVEPATALSAVIRGATSEWDTLEGM